MQSCCEPHEARIHEPLRDAEKIPERLETTERIASSRERTKSIGEAALERQNPSELCPGTMTIYSTTTVNRRYDPPLPQLKEQQ